MTLPRFFLEGPWSEGQLPLTESDTHHARAVLRVRPGDEIVIVDPDGCGSVVRVEDVDHGVSATYVRAIECPWQPRVVLAPGLARNAKMDLVVQKATELGVEAVAPLLFERSIVRMSEEKSQRRAERWRRIAYEAAKQSQRSHVPYVHAPVTLSEAASTLTATDHLLVFWEDADAPGVREALAGVSSCDSVTVVVGPEGGLSEAEVGELTGLGGVLVSLGSTILRTETAGIAAVALVTHEFGGLGGVRRG